MPRVAHKGKKKKEKSSKKFPKGHSKKALNEISFFWYAVMLSVKFTVKKRSKLPTELNIFSTG